MHKISLTLFLFGLCTTTIATNDRSKDPVEIVFTYQHNKHHQAVVPTYDGHISFNPWQYDSNQFAMSIKQHGEKYQYTAAYVAQARKSVSAQLFDNKLKIHSNQDYHDILAIWFKTTVNGMNTIVKFIFPKSEELTCKMCAPREEEYARAEERMLEDAPILMAIAKSTIGEMNIAKTAAAKLAEIDESQNLARTLAKMLSEHEYPKANRKILPNIELQTVEDLSATQQELHTWLDYSNKAVTDIARKKAESSNTLDMGNNTPNHPTMHTTYSALSILCSSLFESRASQHTASAISKDNESVQSKPTANKVTNRIIEEKPQANCSMRKLQSTHVESGQVLKPMLTMLLLILFVCALGACNIYNLFKVQAELTKYITDSTKASTLPIYHYKL